MFAVLSRQPYQQTGFKVLSRTPTIIALVCLLLSIVVVLAVTLVQIHHKKVLSPGLKYGIVLDAGSSRTTVYVYEWPAEKENDTGVVSQTFRCSVKGPGISSYANNPQEMVKPINNCMNKVKEKIPSHLHKNTPVYLGATAGMRLLRLQNETAANEVLKNIQNYFSSQAFDFRVAQIITGQEEGLYGWITANYLMGNFLENSRDQAKVDNPCYPRNYETALTMKHLYGSRCTESLRPANYNPGKLINFRGTGDPAVCQEKVSSLFNVAACNVKGEDCPFNGIQQPKLKGKFVAFAGFYYTANALNLTGSFPLADFNSRMRVFCSQDWNQLPFMLPKFEEVYARSYCFSANYIYHLFVQGYKFSPETWPQIYFQKEVGNSSIAWSLGYMLSLTNMIKAESQLIQLPVNSSLFAGLLFVFTAVALLCLIFVVYLCVVSFMQKNISHMDHVLATQ
ncbi:ectonucleoside triphosphate diphosphohydrolase 3 isoform X2 [Carettochelys insculpta]|uniref:ectonucleoside triphosphate diphosphohydrolase 3 isoform X2 n=1 Tax=Carettochelys insculpta TaxID=44489 RepID=UPI003EC060E2